MTYFIGRFMNSLTAGGLAVLMLGVSAPQASAADDDYRFPPGLPLSAVVAKGAAGAGGTKLNGTVIKSEESGIRLLAEDGKTYSLKWDNAEFYMDLAEGDPVAVVMGPGTSLKAGIELKGKVTKLTEQGLGFRVKNGSRYYVQWGHIQRIAKENAAAAKPVSKAAAAEEAPAEEQSFQPAPAAEESARRSTTPRNAPPREQSLQRFSDAGESPQEPAASQGTQPKKRFLQPASAPQNSGRNLLKIITFGILGGSPKKSSTDAYADTELTKDYSYDDKELAKDGLR
jgi:hypothetical protein